MKAADLPLHPGKVLRLEPSAFAATWNRAPAKGVALGLRTVSDGEESTARARAERVARDECKHQDPENYLDAYNDALMAGIVSRAVCDPNDAKKPHPVLRSPEDTLQIMLTPETIRWLFEELEQLQVESSPLHIEADDDAIAALIAVLSMGEALKALDRVDAKRVRRFLRYALDELRDPDDETDETPLTELH